MFNTEPGYVSVNLYERYDIHRKVSETEWNACRDFEILESSLSHVDVECVRFLKLLIGKFYVLNRRDDYKVSVEDVRRAIRVTPEEAVRIMFRSYAKLSKVKVVERSKSKGTKYFHIEERFKPLLAKMKVYDKENPKFYFNEYRDVIHLSTEDIQQLVMELPMPASILSDFDRFVREILPMFPAVISRCKAQAEQDGDKVKADDDAERYNTNKQITYLI